MIFNATFTISFFVLAGLVTSQALAQGGPPLVTDDPGTPGDKHWEANIAGQWAANDEGQVLQFPLFDINYGLGEHLQLNLNLGYISVDPAEGEKANGSSVTSAAVKWRFADEDKVGVAISTYPRADFHAPFSSDNPSVNSPGSRYFLPLEFSKEFGKIGVNPEVGYAVYTKTASEWVYGLALSYAFEKERELLFEIHGRSLVGASDRELLYNFGTRYSFSETTSLLVTFGRTFVAYADESPALNAYLGWQIRI